MGRGNCYSLTNYSKRTKVVTSGGVEALVTDPGKLVHFMADTDSMSGEIHVKQALDMEFYLKTYSLKIQV